MKPIVTLPTLKKWTLCDLITAMANAGWNPMLVPGHWRHPGGASVNLNALMRDKQEYWHQLAERNVTPPTTDVPENWGRGEEKTL